MPTSGAAIGFVVKSGRAHAVLLSGRELPEVVASELVPLSDPDDPAARQPYHDGFGTAREPGPGLERLVASVRQFGERSVSALIARTRAARPDLVGVGIVVGSLADPRTITNPHIRIHALEGCLFREIVVGAAATMKVASSVWRQRDLLGVASRVLGPSEAEVSKEVAALGRHLRHWAVEQKAAALAAWLVLASPSK